MTGKLARKTVAFLGSFGPGTYFLQKWQAIATAAGGTVVDVEKTVPNCLVLGEGRGGKPPAQGAKLKKQHPAITLLELPDFCRLLLLSREEFLAELRAGRRDHDWWERFTWVVAQSGTKIDLSGADLRKTNLHGSKLHLVNIDGADFRNIAAHYAEFGDLQRGAFDEADLSHAYFHNAEDCSFRKATMSESWLGHGNADTYRRCDFSDAKLLKAQATRCRFPDCDFRGADLSDADIRNSDFSGANFAGANLSRAHGFKDKFTGANLSGAVLHRADLRDASFVNADLRNADLREAALAGADLTGAKIDGADFAGAVLTGTKLAGLDLSLAKNLEAPKMRTAGPKLAELARAAATSKAFATSARVELGGGEHATLVLWREVRRGRAYVHARSEYRRDDNRSVDLIDAPTFEQGILNLADRWPQATLRLDTIAARGCRSPRGKQLLDLATAAWAEAFGLATTALEALEEQKKDQQAELQQLRETMLAELRGGPNGVTKWNARPVHDREKIGPLHGLDLGEVNLAGVQLDKLDLQGSRFDGAVLTGAKLGICKLQSASFARADLTGASLSYLEADGANFEDAKLAGCYMFLASLKNANCRRADLTGADLMSAYLQGADFTGAKLDRVDFTRAKYDAGTKFPKGFRPPASMEWQGPPRGVDLKPGAPGSMDFATFFQQLGYKIDLSRLVKAKAMLKADRFQLFAEVGEAVAGIVKSQSDKDLVYCCRLDSGGKFSCCTQNLKPCGGLQGALCKHLLVLIVGLAKAGRLDPATVASWVDASKQHKPEIDKSAATETFLRYKGAEAGQVDWRPTETVPEDYYAL
jgi:uncharacterized protein YjbI with pentapeptide repeats